MLDFVPLSIEDSPRFGWRGYMVDSSRHFIPTAQLLSMLDGMYATSTVIQRHGPDHLGVWF